MKDKVLYQLMKYHLPLVAVHKLGKIFLLFTSDGIYTYGDEKEIIKFQKSHKQLSKRS